MCSLSYFKVELNLFHPGGNFGWQFWMCIVGMDSIHCFLKCGKHHQVLNTVWLFGLVSFNWCWILLASVIVSVIYFIQKVIVIVIVIGPMQSNCNCNLLLSKVIDPMSASLPVPSFLWCSEGCTIALDNYQVVEKSKSKYDHLAVGFLGGGGDASVVERFSAFCTTTHCDSMLQKVVSLCSAWGKRERCQLLRFFTVYSIFSSISNWFVVI